MRNLELWRADRSNLGADRSNSEIGELNLVFRMDHKV